MELLEHTPRRVLAIVAHPDDIEYGAAAAVAMWTSAGADCRYLLASRGEAGIDGMDPKRAAEVREAEQIRSADVVGVSVVEFLSHPDGTIHDSMALRQEFAQAIRRHQPDTVLLFNHRETWGPHARNSADHRAVGTAALDAIGDAGNRWIFPGTPPHSVRIALVAGSPRPPMPSTCPTAWTERWPHCPNTGHTSRASASIRWPIPSSSGLSSNRPAIGWACLPRLPSRCGGSSQRRQLDYRAPVRGRLFR